MTTQDKAPNTIGAIRRSDAAATLKDAFAGDEEVVARAGDDLLALCAEAAPAQSFSIWTKPRLAILDHEATTGKRLREYDRTLTTQLARKVNVPADVIRHMLRMRVILGSLPSTPEPFAEP